MIEEIKQKRADSKKRFIDNQKPRYRLTLQNGEIHEHYALQRLVTDFSLSRHLVHKQLNKGVIQLDIRSNNESELALNTVGCIIERIKYE